MPNPFSRIGKLLRHATSTPGRQLRKKERKWQVPLRRRRPDLWMRGFLSESGVLYDFDRHGHAAYLSDWARFGRTPGLNHPRVIPVARNKLFFHTAMTAAGFGDYIPTLHGVIVDGRYHTDGPDDETTMRDLPDLVRTEGGLAVKPIVGGGGRGVAILRHVDDSIRYNGATLTDSETVKRLSRLRASLVESLLVPHDYGRELYPATVNTIRILTMRDSGGPFVAVAVHRIGSDAAPRTDNWTRGGLSCAIDPDNGVMGPGVTHPGTGRRLVWHDKHPDSGAELTGRVIPHWDDAVALVLDIMRRLRYLRYIGWDVVITPAGPRVIEANNYSDVNLLQVHGPLLADDRVRQFYRRHGVV